MDLTAALTRVEAAMTRQFALAGEAAGVHAEALYGAIEPAIRQLALDLAEQAAAEIGAQLPGHTIDVVLADGEPTLRVNSSSGPEPVLGDELDARLTLRLPAALKQLVEAEAEDVGDSVNSWVVRTLSSRASAAEQRHRRGAEARGEFRT